MAAGELALMGLSPLVLEQADSISLEPKANALRGQVLRMLDMRGLYGRITGTTGRPKADASYTFSGIPVALENVVQNPLMTEFISQPALTKHLMEWATGMGVEVRWNHKVSDFTQLNDGIEILAECGSEQLTLTADYVIAADGAHSIFRKKSGISFEGVTHDVVAYRGNVSIPSSIKNSGGGFTIPGVGEVGMGHTRFDGGCLLVLEPQPGRTMLATVEFSPSDNDEEVTLQALRESVQRVVGSDVGFSAPDYPGPHALRRWSGQNTRLAEQYRHGNIFLLGDSAHVHSPMGGPGLNLALQDAVNLAWKVAATLRGKAPEGLLDTYFTERHPLAQRLMMHSMAQLGLMMPGPEITAVRELLQELLATPSGANYIARLVAGSDIQYETGSQHPLAGSFVPDWQLDEQTMVTDLLHSARPVLLHTAGPSIADALTPWGDDIDLVSMPCPEAPEAVLIRPDGYIVWAGSSSSRDRKELEVVLHRWFGTRESGSNDSGILKRAAPDLKRSPRPHE